MCAKVSVAAKLVVVVSVLLTLASCQPFVKVPDVVGLSRIEAEPEILRFGLLIGSVTEQYDPSVTAGIVLDQEPAGGAVVTVGTSVDLEVSSLPPA